MRTKYLLFVGDDESTMFALSSPEERIQIGLNFDQSPSVAILAEQTVDLAQRSIDSARSQGIKVGTYAELDKGVEWMQKVLNLQAP